MPFMVKDGIRARRYCFTSFRGLSAVSATLAELGFVRGAIYQEEECPTSARRHIQGYIECLRPVALATVRSGMAGDHVEVCRGSQAANVAYCTKPDSRVSGSEPSTFGTLSGQGSRTDLSSVCGLVEEGLCAKRIAEEHPETFVKYHKGIERLISLRENPRDFKTEVIVIWGEPGSGKTQYCVSQCDTFAFLPVPQGESQWFDGAYQGDVIIDEFYGWLKWSLMLQLMDKYALTVPVKGGMVQWVVKRLFITSNCPPSEWYKYGRKMPVDAFKRRIDKLYRLDKCHNYVPAPTEWS